MPCGKPTDVTRLNDALRLLGGVLDLACVVHPPDGAGHTCVHRQGAAVGLLVGTLIHGQERVEEPLREAILQVRLAT